MRKSVFRGVSSLLFVALVITGLMLLPAPLSLAQSTVATLRGTVVDPNGAVVPDAQITITNVNTNARQQVATNKEGSFFVPQLDPGKYKLRAMHQGFAALEIPDVVLNTSDRREIRLQLKVGQASESITVEAGFVGVETTAAVTTVVDNQFVDNIPLNGRSFQSLILMLPGVTNGPDGEISFNGQRSNDNYFTVDGVSVNFGVTVTNPGLGRVEGQEGSRLGTNAFGGTNSLISVDALQEFKVQSSTYSAEFGRQSGGQVQLTSRAGTNQYHGSLYDYFRNDVLDANDWFNNFYKRPKSPMRQNNFGGTIGGPVFLPKLFHGRDRTFFFFSYEGMRLLQPASAQSFNIPSIGLRNYPGLASGIKQIFDAYPIPQGTENTVGVVPYTFTASNPKNMNAYRVNLDHNLTSRLKITGAYNVSPSSSTTWTLNNQSITEQKLRTITLGAVALITKNLSNDVRANYTTNSVYRRFELLPLWGAQVPPMTVFGDSPWLNEKAYIQFQVMGVPIMNVGQAIENMQRQINIVDGLTWARGSHVFKFGVDYRHVFPRLMPYDYNLALNFNQLDDIKLNKVTQVTTHSMDTMSIVTRNLSAFAQDSWRLRRNLTLDFGVRWEYNPPSTGQRPDDLLYVQGWKDISTMTLAPAGTPGYDTVLTAFAPRVGVSYHLRGKSGWETVLRAGYSLAYGMGNRLGGNSGSYYPHYRTGGGPKVSYPLSGALLNPPPPFTVAAPYPSGQLWVATLEDYALPRTHQWTVTAQQSLSPSQMLSVSYVGNAARKLMRRSVSILSSSVNQNFPGGSLWIARNDGDYGDSSDYHSMQVQFLRRLTTGLQVLANHTWAHGFDTGSDDLFSFSSKVGIDNPSKTRGNSAFDRRHVFNLALSYQFPKLHHTGPLARPVGIALKALTNGWAVDSTFKAQTGTPMTVIFYRLMSPVYPGSWTVRPDLVPGVPQWVDDPASPGGKKLNTAAFGIPASALGPLENVGHGNLPRNGVYGYGSNQVDLSIRREFPLFEQAKVQFRAEFFNLLNHPNFRNPQNNMGTVGGTPAKLTPASNFGQPISMLNKIGGFGGLSALYVNGGSRSTQLALKLVF